MNKVAAWLSAINPVKFFAVVASIMGLCLILLTPPFQVPDEINHFYKAYQISEGTFRSEIVDHRLGGELPKSLVAVTTPFMQYRWNRNNRVRYEMIDQQRAIPLDEGNRVFVDFPNTARYTPVSYLPQAFAIFALRKCQVSPMGIFYGARVFTLLVWIICICLAIKIIPFYKWLLTLLALLPMSVFTNMSLSADVVTNCLAFLVIAYTLHLAFRERHFGFKDFFMLASLIVLLASAKLVYTPLVFLFVLIPVDRFKQRLTFFATFVALLVLGLGTFWFWSADSASQGISFDAYNPAYQERVDIKACSNMQAQIAHIKSDPSYLPRVVTSSMVGQFDLYKRSYIGTLGWFDTNLPPGLITLAYVAIFLVALLERPQEARLRAFQRLVMLMSACACIFLLLLSQLLIWECVGASVIANTQGRYFIPVFPLLFFVLQQSWWGHRGLAALVVMMVAPVILLCANRVLYDRYFAPITFQLVTITCDAEEVTSGGSYRTSIPEILLDNGATQSGEFARSGRTSARVSSQMPSAFKFRLFNGHVGEVIQAEVWRHGRSGSLILSGDRDRALYHTTSKATETDARGWDRLVLTDTLRREFERLELALFVYNPGDSASYFDDLTITIKKRLQ